MTTNHIMTGSNHDQRHINTIIHLMTTFQLTLKMTTAQVVEMSVTDNSLSEDYLTQTITVRQTVYTTASLIITD